MNNDILRWKSVELVNLRQAQEEDFTSFLYSCYNDFDARILFSNDMSIKNHTEFVKDFRKKITYKYHEFMIIKHINTNQPIGFIYSYRYNSNDGTLYTTIYLEPKSRKSVLGAEAGVIFYEYLFNKYSIRKIYCSVYSYNTMSIKLLKNAGFKLEGNLKKSKYFNGTYYDTYIMALYKVDFYNLKDGRLKK